MRATTSKLLLLGILGVSLTASVVYNSLLYFAPNQSDIVRLSASVVTSQTLHSDIFSEIELEARAAYVFDVQSQVPLFARNAEAQLPLASLTKLMAGLVAAERIPWGQAVRIDSESIAQEGDSGFSIGEMLPMRDLLAFSLLESSNDGMHAIAKAADGDVAEFVSKMNSRASALGLAQTHFFNPTGLDTTKQVSGGYGSAHDVALLMAYLLEHEPEVLEPTRHAMKTVTSNAGTLHLAENTNEIVGNVPGLVASKTGYTDLAGGNLVVAFDSGLNHPIIIVALGSTVDGRFRDVQKLIDVSQTALQERHLARTKSAVQ